MAKVYQGESGLWGLGGWGRPLNFLLVGYQYVSFFGRNPLIVAVVGFLALAGLLYSRKEALTRILLAFLVLYTSFYLVLSIPSYHWYYAPHYFSGLIFASVGLDGLIGLSLVKVRPRMRIASASACGFLSVFFLVTQATFTFSTQRAVGEHSSDKKEIALWIKDNTPPHAKIAAVEIGHLGWYSDRYIIDILGLVSPPNDKFLGQRKFSAWLAYYQPDYILAHDPLWPHEVSVRRLREEGTFVPAEGFRFAGNVLLEPASGNRR